MATMDHCLEADRPGFEAGSSCRRLIWLAAASILLMAGAGPDLQRPTSLREPAGEARLNREDPYIGQVITRQLASDFTWGYWCGVKQPLGAYRKGLSIHQFTKSNYPEEVQRGNPDYILWVNEIDDTFGIAERPTGAFDGNVKHPGGMVAFSDDGTIWYDYGGRAEDLPLDLYVSDSPNDTNNFSVVLDDYETQGTSTTPCLHVPDPKLMMFWRHGHSGGVDTTVRLRRYDLTAGFDQPEFEINIGKGVEHDIYGDVGIEQLYTRYDPRYGYAFVSWQWFDTPDLFGSNPFLYSDDDGATWKSADGVICPDLPLDYSEINGIFVPYDHLKYRQHAGWNVEDLGVGPHGTFWTTMPHGYANRDYHWWVHFVRFDGGEWATQRMTQPMLADTKPYACGATKNCLVFLYADNIAFNQLMATVSVDDGATWTDPVAVDTVDPSQTICWVSFVQPSRYYSGDAARFFYSYFRNADGDPGKKYQNSVRWIRLDIEGVTQCPADINGDFVVNIDDLFAVLAVWGECFDCAEDVNNDGNVNIDDLFRVLAGWGPCPQ
jgi:hypothetical protein